MAFTTSPADVTARPTSLPTRDHRARVPGLWRDAAGVVTRLSMLVVVALWVAGGGLQAMATIAGTATGLGHRAVVPRYRATKAAIPASTRSTSESSEYGARPRRSPCGSSRPRRRNGSYA